MSNKVLFIYMKYFEIIHKFSYLQVGTKLCNKSCKGTTKNQTHLKKVFICHQRIILLEFSCLERDTHNIQNGSRDLIWTGFNLAESVI